MRTCFMQALLREDTYPLARASPFTPSALNQDAPANSCSCTDAAIQMLPINGCSNTARAATSSLLYSAQMPNTRAQRGLWWLRMTLSGHWPRTGGRLQGQWMTRYFAGASQGPRQDWRMDCQMGQIARRTSSSLSKSLVGLLATNLPASQRVRGG